MYKNCLSSEKNPKQVLVHIVKFPLMFATSSMKEIICQTKYEGNYFPPDTHLRYMHFHHLKTVLLRIHASLLYRVMVTGYLHTLQNCHDNVTLLAKNPLCWLRSLRRFAYMHHIFRLGTSQLGVWFLCRWYSVLLCVLMRATLLTLKICWRKLCNSMLGLVWISSLVWPPLAFQIIRFNWCHLSNLVSFYNAQGSSVAKIALGICFCRVIMIMYWYWIILMVLYCVLGILFGAPLYAAAAGLISF